MKSVVFSECFPSPSSLPVAGWPGDPLGVSPWSSAWPLYMMAAASGWIIGIRLRQRDEGRRERPWRRKALKPSSAEEVRAEIDRFIRRRSRTKVEAEETERLLSWLLEETRGDSYCEGFDEGRCSSSEDYCA